MHIAPAFLPSVVGITLPFYFPLVYGTGLEEMTAGSAGGAELDQLTW